MKSGRGGYQGGGGGGGGYQGGGGGGGGYQGGPPPAHQGGSHGGYQSAPDAKRPRPGEPRPGEHVGSASGAKDATAAAMAAHETAAEKLARLRAKQAARVGGTYLSGKIGSEYMKK
eukprot:gene7724-1735_t